MPLPEPSPNLAALDLLVSVGELGSISAAARAHGISQPAASMRLRDLESMLGLDLLERSPGGTRFTPAGEAMAEWANVVLRGVAALLAGATALRAARGSKLRVGASMTVAEYLFPGWLHRLSATRPEVGVSLRMGNSEAVSELVLAGDADLGFVEGPTIPVGLASRTLLRDRLVVAVGADHRWAHRGDPLTPAELAATPLALREVGSGTRAVLDDALADLGLVGAGRRRAGVDDGDQGGGGVRWATGGRLGARAGA